MIKSNEQDLDDFIAITKALSDTHRVRALFALRKGELCMCQIIELLGLAPSTISKHMSVLKQAGLVENRKEERWMFYRLPKENEMPVMIKNMFTWMFEVLSPDSMIKDDNNTLGKIRMQDLTKLCKVQRRK
jgi:ArsR family transcriptional regulator, arsenate/arsenite/antimonite-responsive transcriptional repressor